jgi:hypothetical protein
MEERLKKLESKVLIWQTAFTVVTVIVLGWLGFTNWVSVPKAIDDYWHSKVGQDLDAKIAAINSEYEKLQTGGKAIEDKLGITAIKTEISNIESHIQAVESGLADVRRDLLTKVSFRTGYSLKSTPVWWRLGCSWRSTPASPDREPP